MAGFFTSQCFDQGRVKISAVELAYMDVWPAQTVRTDMIEATGRRT